MCSLSPAALTGERPAAHPTVSCCRSVDPLVVSLSRPLSVTRTHRPHLDLLVHIYDIVADCSDNVPTRYLVNDACVLSGKPLVSASALRLEGQVR